MFLYCQESTDNHFKKDNQKVPSQTLDRQALDTTTLVMISVEQYLLRKLLLQYGPSEF